MFQRYSERVPVEHSIDDLIEAIVDLVHRELIRFPDGLVLNLELYTLAMRKPQFRRVTHRWMQNSHGAPERFVDPGTVFDLGALIKGLFIHTSLDQPARPPGEHRTRGTQTADLSRSGNPGQDKLRRTWAALPKASTAEASDP